MLSLICAVAALFFGGPIAAKAELAPAPPGQQPSEAAISPDDPRLLLMIRNAIIALNQANLTGNYSVLRDMGTPNFQISNSSARLAEAFAALRSRKIDISPIMFFNPKLLSAPSMQDGKILRLTGVFPTSPEQVSFDLAFQLYGEQWMLAAIAVNVAPPSENAQVFAAPQGRPGEPADSKPIRIDLSQPAPPAAAHQAATKKPAAKKPKSQTAAAHQPSPAAPAAEQPPAPTEPAGGQPAPSSERSDTGASWNPFGR